MVHRNFLTAALVALALSTASCGGSKTQVKNPDETGDESDAAKVPPPPPKCESLDENCAAKSGTMAKVKLAGLEFKPPEKWKYAQGETYSIMQASSEGNAAALVIGSYMPDKDAKKDAAARDAVFADLLKAIGATLPKGYKINWKKPEAPMEANGLKMGTWLVPTVERAGLKDKKGNMPVVQAPIDATHNMLAIGFVLEEDEKGLEAIQNVLTSIKPDTSAKDGAKDGDKKPVEVDKK